MRCAILCSHKMNDGRLYLLNTLQQHRFSIWNKKKHQSLKLIGIQLELHMYMQSINTWWHNKIKFLLPSWVLLKVLFSIKKTPQTCDCVWVEVPRLLCHIEDSWNKGFGPRWQLAGRISKKKKEKSQPLKGSVKDQDRDYGRWKKKVLSGFFLRLYLDLL